MENIIIQNWDKITTLIFALLSVFFAWLSFWYSKLAYSRNSFFWEVSINKWLADFWALGIKEIVTFSFINAGHRKWIIRNVYLESYNKKSIFFSMINRNFFINWMWLPNFPFELDEMWEISFSMYENDFVKMIQESYNKEGEKVKYLCFTDNTWNIYKKKIIKRYWKKLFI